MNEMAASASETSETTGEANGVRSIPSFRFDIGTSPDFTRLGHGKRLRALGGSFSECRSVESSRRFLTVPNTTEGRAFAAEVGSLFGADCIVLKPSSRRLDGSDGDTVHRIRQRKAPSGEMAKVIDNAFARFEGNERVWGETKGIALAAEQKQREEEVHERAVAAAPGEIAHVIRRFRALGLSPETIRTAVEDGLRDDA